MYGFGFNQQAGMPDLIAFLHEEYAKDMQKRLDEAASRGKDVLPLDKALYRAPASDFIRFARNYLNENRPAETFAVDENMGVRLTNSRLIVISPAVDVRGTMQASGAIAVTHGISQSGNEGVLPGGAIGI